MVVSEADLKYLDRRRSLAKRSTIVGIVLLVAIIGVAVYLYFASPLLMNPGETAALLQAEQVPPPTMAEMAAKLPIVFLVCCALMVAMVLYQLAAAANERRLLRILDALIERVSDEGADGPVRRRD
jgi:hypothetical protein